MRDTTTVYHSTLDILSTRREAWLYHAALRRLELRLLAERRRLKRGQMQRWAEIDATLAHLALMRAHLDRGAPSALDVEALAALLGVAERSSAEAQALARQWVKERLPRRGR
jgi:hypothetical protein